jgi:hypothetical protein
VSERLRNPIVGVNDLLQVLTRARVDFVVCGGIACILHGVQRTTADVDCAVSLTDDSLRRLVEALRPLGFRLRAPEPLEALLNPNRRRAWIEEKHATVATLVSEQSAAQLDIFLTYPVPFDRLKADAMTISTDAGPIYVSSKAHLIEAKSAVKPERTIDRRDIEDLQELIRREERTA